MRERSTVEGIVVAVFMLLGMGFFTVIGLFFLAFSGRIEYIPLLLVVAVTLYAWFVLLIFFWFRTKKRKRVFAGIAAAAIVISSIVPIREAYKQSIPTVDAEVDIFQYEPFSKDANIATLDEQAALQLTDNLPRIDGATALYPLYAAFVQATYPKKEYYPYDSEVMVNRTPEAYNNLIAGNVDMIFALSPSEAQVNEAKKRGLEFHLTPIGREAFVFFVNQKNKVTGLTTDQIRDIYSGKLTNWKEVGGADDSIRAFQRPADSGSQTALEQFMGDTPIMKAPTENVAEGMGGIINQVSQYRNYKNAIGYTFRFYSMQMVGNDQIKLLEIDGVAPAKETIRSGAYPLTSEFYIVTTNTDNPNVQKLIDWVLSEQGQLLVEKVGYVPVR